MGKSGNLESIKIVLFLHFFEERIGHECYISKKNAGQYDINNGIHPVVLDTEEEIVSNEYGNKNSEDNEMWFHGVDVVRFGFSRCGFRV